MMNLGDQHLQVLGTTPCNLETLSIGLTCITSNKAPCLFSTPGRSTRCWRLL
jgi:hypothetical protein